MKIEDSGVRIMWSLPSPEDSLVLDSGISIREFHYQVLDLDGSFLINSTKPLETNAQLAKFFENNDYKVLRVPYKAADSVQLF